VTPRAIALFGLALPLVAFVPLAVQAWRKDVWEWDRILSEWIHAYENESTLLNRYVDVLGLPLHWSVQAVGAFAVVGAAIIAARCRCVWRGAFLLAGLAGAIALTPVLKEVFAAPPVDPRPGGRESPLDLSGSGYSFPSGHALRTVVFVGCLAAVTRGRSRRLVLLVGTGLSVAVGIGVVYHEWHWTADVLGGWLTGIAWVALLWLVFRPDRDRAVGGSA
jgi:membrane-associated phospholipid phosphatase